MGMSTHVQGFRPPDEKWKKMKAVWDACVAAELEIPADVEEFFNFGDGPDDAGVVIDVEELPACSEYQCDGGSGFEVDLTKLPKDITILRFYNSW